MRALGTEDEAYPIDDSLKQPLIESWRTANISPINKTILEFAEKATLSAHTISQTDIDDLKSHGLSERAIHDIVQVCAFFNYINRLADALGVELEG